MIDKKTLSKLDNQEFRDAILFDAENPSGRIIGRYVRINVDNDRNVIIIDNAGIEMLRKPPSSLTLYYHQGWGGINLVCHDDIDDFTLTMHYISHIKK